MLEYKTDDKVIMVNNISTIDGTLYKDTIVKVRAVGFPDKDLEVQDPVGKLWYVNTEDVQPSNHPHKI